MPQIVLATTTRYASVDEVRCRLAQQMVRAAHTEGFGIVVVDGSPTEEVRAALENAGAVVLREETGATMGAGRRLALQEAGALCGTDGACAWIEPEKFPLVPSLRRLCAPIFAGTAHITVPARTEAGFASYPAVQAFAEQCGNAIFAKLAGTTLDMWFGPRAMHVRGLAYFARYAGDYGDRWDAIFIPVLRALRDGLCVVSVPVDYCHPAEQTRVEADDRQVGILKRLEQLTTLARALCEESAKLGFSVP